MDPLPKIRGNTKSRRLYELLKEQILAGRFSGGSQLPSCRQLAQDYDVSYVTASQVLKSLVNEGLALKQPGKGIFLPHENDDVPVARKVRLVLSRVHGPNSVAFFQVGKAVLEAAGWEVAQEIQPSPEGFVEALRTDIESSFIHLGALPRAAADMVERLKAQRRVIIFSARMDVAGLSAIIGDEAQVIRKCMKVLQESGARRVALLCGNIANYVEQERLAVWRHFYPGDGWRDLFFDFRLGEHPERETDIHRFIERYLASPGVVDRLMAVDGLIAPGPEMAAAAQLLFLDRGRRVPEDVSIISINDAEYLPLMRPRISVMDSNLPEHFAAAVEIMERRRRGLDDLPLLHMCRPRYIERDSVRAPMAETAREPEVAGIEVMAGV